MNLKFFTLIWSLISKLLIVILKLRSPNRKRIRFRLDCFISANFYSIISFNISKRLIKFPSLGFKRQFKNANYVWSIVNLIATHPLFELFKIVRGFTSQVYISLILLSIFFLQNSKMQRLPITCSWYNVYCSEASVIPFDLFM